MMKKIMNVIANVAITISGLLFIVIFLIIICEIVARSFFNYSILWVTDFITLSASWMIMLGMAYSVYKGEHLVIDFIKKKFKLKRQRIISIITSVLATAFFLILIPAGWSTAMVKMKIVFTTLRWPTGYAFMALPVFALFSFIFMVYRLMRLFKEPKEFSTNNESA